MMEDGVRSREEWGRTITWSLITVDDNFKIATDFVELTQNKVSEYGPPQSRRSRKSQVGTKGVMVWMTKD